jgi:predicted Zn-dependent peptidase
LKSKYKYETIEGDPLGTRIYVLENGLKVFLSVYNDAPRIQTYIAVRAGSKMDPSETTGLAHYFEHMMFKGTSRFGTTDWVKESNLINKIESLFESYRKETDENKRLAIYREIDKTSYEASLLAIPNEYDKLMDVIGSQGSNAGTSNDYTVFMENIPSNQVENWARIEAERFSDPVLRLFHTELETVYEEKNMSLTNDNRKATEVMMQMLFPNHPYGNQTTLGEAEHLKNPSMKRIREFFSTYYVPNNMAICMSGEFDPDTTIETIDRYFGVLKPGNVPVLKYDQWSLPDTTVLKVIKGLEAENVRIGYGFDIKAKDQESLLLTMTASVLSNGKAGLIDLNLIQPQKVINAYAYDAQLSDYGFIVLGGIPTSSQSLDEVKDLLLKQVELLKNGKFPDWLNEAIYNNIHFDILSQNGSINGRAMSITQAWLNDIPYPDFTEYIPRMAKISKEDVIEFANKNLINPVIIFKKQMPPDEETKIRKPEITPIHINRDEESDFYKVIKEVKIPDVEPEYLDYSKDLDILHLINTTRVIYKENTENEIFQLVYYYKMGKTHDKVMNFAVDLFPYLGTSKHTVEQINIELFRLACNLQVKSTDDETSISISGLQENMDAALDLLEELINDPLPDETMMASRIENTLKARLDKKSNQNEIFSALVSFGIYGTSSPYKNILTEDELYSLTVSQIIGKIKALNNTRHDILYYGKADKAALITMLEKYHHNTEQILPVPSPLLFIEKETSENRILFAPYDAKQAKLQTIIKGGSYDRSLAPVTALFNMYFGDIVFQELREKRALAYTAGSRYQEPSDLEKLYLNKGYIATQSDKIMEALIAFDDLFKEMPLSENRFQTSKSALLNKISTERIHKMNCIWNFLNSEKLGLRLDIRKEIVENVREMVLEDLVKFENKYLSNKAKTYLVLGNEPDVDFDHLQTLGPVKKLTLEDIFGY